MRPEKSHSHTPDKIMTLAKPNQTRNKDKFGKNHSSHFKKEFRKITRQWNKLNKPNLMKIKAKTQRTLPCLKVKLHDDIFVESLIDTGASQNFISLHLYRKLKKLKMIKETNKWEGIIKAANEGEIKIFCECKVPIKIDSFSWTEKFLVIKERAYDMILGIPFLHNKSLTIDFGSKTCYFKFCPKKTIKLLENDSYNLLSMSEIQTDSSDMTEEINKLVNQYSEVFTDKIGEAIDLEVKLELNDHTPVCIRPYYLSPPSVTKMKKIIDEWLEQDIIEPSTSPYSSPAFLTAKDRLVVNYSELNKKLVKMDYPIGDLQNMHQHLQGASYYSVIDLNKAFLQCKLAPESRDITSFSTIFGKYRMKRVCFGLQVGSSVLSSYLDNIFHDIKFKYVINFCDDIVIYSPDKKSHLQHLKEVINRLAQKKLTVNVQKAKFFCREISFLGHLIKENSITIDPERTASVMKFPEPRTVKQVRQFTGMCGYWSKYISNYADICRPLHALKKKGAKFKWTPECQAAFDTLKAKIANPPVLQLANFKKPFVVQTDASEYGCGATLLQENERGDLLPIAFYSKKFTDAELKYSIYEKEAYSAILAIEKWHQFLEVQPFTLVTDNQALSYVLNSKRKLGRLTRWVERLLNLPFTVVHKKGSENLVADALSRLFDVERPKEKEDMEMVNLNKKLDETRINLMKRQDLSRKTNVNNCTVNGNEEQNSLNIMLDIPLGIDDIKYQQKQDKECIDIVKSIVNKTNQECFTLKNDILLYQSHHGKPRVYLPSHLTNVVFAFYHNSLIGGHLGIARTLAKIKEYFYHPDLENKIKQKIKDCHICAMSKTAQRKYEGKLISLPIETNLNTVFIDILGPLPTSKAGNKYILVMVDGFSRFVWLHALREATSKQIINKLKLTFANFSIPRILVSDNAKCFTSNEFKAYLFKNCIQGRKIPIYRAAGNRSERMIRDVSTLLRCFYYDKQTNWDQDLDAVQMSLNTAKNSSTGYTAFQLMFNHHANNALSNTWNLHDLLSHDLSKEEKQEQLQRAVKNIKRSVAKNRERDRYSAARRQHPFKINSLVFWKTHYLSDKAKKFSKKLARKYFGPYKIIWFITDVSVLIQHVHNPSDIKKVHIIDLKLYKQ